MKAVAEFEPLLTERLRLRRSVPDDADQIAAYRSEPAVFRYQGWERVDAEGIRAELEEMATRDPGVDGWVQFSVEERDTGRLIGDVGLSPVDGEPGVIKIGYTIAPAFQGRGYATEAMSALSAYAFDTLGARLLRAYASAENLPSHRVAERIGMRLVERFGRGHGDQRRYVVRYELNRDDR
jgi:RimJ/RimL family protein N-acetyltransferase